MAGFEVTLNGRFWVSPEASLNQQLRDSEPWQFEITKTAHGRVHGLLIDDTFYVVWIDPQHLLYS